MIQRHHDSHHSGFTVIELLLAMTFVSLLLLGVATTTMQIAAVYNKGLTMKAVDQAGRTVTDDMRQTLAQSRPFVIDDTSLLEMRGPDSGADTIDGGRLCTGLYSYVWNTGDALSAGTPVNRYASLTTISIADDSREIRLVRVRDNEGRYCADPAKLIEQGAATELLATGEAGLAVHSLKVTRLANDPVIGQALYRVQLAIGTNDHASIDTLSGTCKPPSDKDALQDFCAVNVFDFTAQAGNKGGLSS